MTLISTILGRDHSHLRHEYNKILESKSLDTQIRWQNKFVWELARYIAAEGMVIIPAIKERLENADEMMIAKDKEEHEGLKWLLKQFQNTSPEDDNFRPHLDQIMDQVEKHLSEEEKVHMPWLEKKLDPKQSEVMARRYVRMKSLVPTRGHPTKGPEALKAIENFLEMSLDKLADMTRKFPENCELSNDQIAGQYI